MNILKALLTIFIILPGCIKKREASLNDLPAPRQALDLPSDEDLEDDTSLPECGERNE